MLSMAEMLLGRTLKAEVLSLFAFDTAPAFSPEITSGQTSQQQCKEIFCCLKRIIPFLPRVKEIIQI